MTQYMAPPPNHRPRSDRKGRKTLKVAALGAASLVLLLASCGTGVAIGSGTPATVEKTVEVPGPTVTEKVEVEKIVEVPGPEVEVEKIVEVTPQACITALDAASEAILAMQDFPAMVNDAAQSGFTEDVAGLEDVVARMDAVTVVMDRLTPVVAESAAECRAGQ